jgi:DNA replication protein DnaC
LGLDLRLTNRLQKARLRQQATVADLDYSAARGLDKTVIRALARNRWVRENQNFLIVAATGTGKTYLACALAHAACLAGHTVRYHRLSRLLSNLLLARADGTYPKRILDLARADVLVLDDFGLTPITDAARTELFEILEDRHGQQSTVLTAQLPIAAWHETVGEATVADAILDRLVHNAHRIELKGDSLRRRRATPSNPTEEPTEK